MHFGRPVASGHHCRVLEPTPASVHRHAAGDTLGRLPIANLPSRSVEIGMGTTSPYPGLGSPVASGSPHHRAPSGHPWIGRSYFHNGMAKDLWAVVDFYNTRFNIGFTK